MGTPSDNFELKAKVTAPSKSTMSTHTNRDSGTPTVSTPTNPDSGEPTVSTPTNPDSGEPLFLHIPADGTIETRSSDNISGQWRATKQIKMILGCLSIVSLMVAIDATILVSALPVSLAMTLSWIHR